MKKSRIILLVILILVLIGTFSFAKGAKGDSKCRHVYTEATCLKKATCTKCGREKGNFGSHKWGNSWTARKATCTKEGISRKKCSVCGKTTDKSISKLGHNYGAWSDLNANEHIHYCQRAGCTASESKPHNNNKKEKITSNDLQHKTYCDICNHYMGLEAHKWPGINQDEHKCRDCHYVPAGKNRYHYYNIGNGGTIQKLSYNCQFCGTENTLKLNQTIDKLNIQDYACSDAEIKMKEPPEFSRGTYTATWEGTLRNSDGNIASNIKVPDKWITIYGWTQKSVDTHRKKTPDYKGEAVGNLLQGVFPGKEIQALRYSICWLCSNKTF